MRGLSSARPRPPANRQGVRLPRKAYIVRSRYTYTYTTPPVPPPPPGYPHGARAGVMAGPDPPAADPPGRARRPGTPAGPGRPRSREERAEPHHRP